MKREQSEKRCSGKAAQERRAEMGRVREKKSALRRMLAGMLAAAMLLGMLPAVSVPVFAADTAIGASGNITLANGGS